MSSICVTAVLICGMVGCQVEQSAGVQTNSEVTAETVTEEVTTSSETTTTSATEATTAVTEPTNDPETLINEYLDYFEKNKDGILTDDTGKYRIHFYQTYGSEEPEMVVEDKRVFSDESVYCFRTVYGKRDGKTDKLYTDADEKEKDFFTGEQRSKLYVSSDGTYYEILTQYTEYEDNNTLVEYILSENCPRASLDRQIISADTLEQLADNLYGTFADSDKWGEDLYNPETGKYELYVYSSYLIEEIGDVDIVNLGYNIPYSRVSKETYYSAWDRYTSDLTELTVNSDDAVKYSSEWMDADDILDKAEIIKDACGALSTEE